MTIHLRSILGNWDDTSPRTAFPFSLPAIAALAPSGLAFPSAVTFFVGENGSGKSTLLEGIAVAARLVTVGSAQASADASLVAGQALARSLRLQWTKRTHRGFFMRAEDFFGYARRMQAMREEYAAEIRDLEADSTLSDRARGFAIMPHARELGEIDRRYGAGLDNRSHGEAFIALFQARFVPDGLYLLDEPEAPLSPRRQLAFLAMMLEMVREQGAQFVIATHSPILMAYPGATIYAFDDGIRAIAYDEIDHVAITRDFLANPELFLRHL